MTLFEVDSQSNAVAVGVDGHLAYLLTNYSGLYAIDVSQPSAPQKVRSYDVLPAGQGLSITGARASIASDGGMFEYDLTQSGGQPVATWQEVPNPAGIAPVGRFVAAGSWSTSPSILDVSHPASLFVAAKAPGSAQSPIVAASEGRLYFRRSYWSNGWHSPLVIASLQPPAPPQPLGELDLMDWTNAVAVENQHAYLATDSLRIVDARDPSSPLLAGALTLPESALGIAVSWPYAYVATPPRYQNGAYAGGGLRIIDVRNPAHPFQIGYFDPPEYTQGVALLNGVAYLEASEGLLAVDARTPSAPVLVSKRTDWGFIGAVATGNNHVYITTWGAVRILRPNADGTLTEVASAALPETGDSIAVDGPNVYVSGRAMGFYMLKWTGGPFAPPTPTPTPTGPWARWSSDRALPVGQNGAISRLLYGNQTPQAPLSASLEGPARFANGAQDLSVPLPSGSGYYDVKLYPAPLATPGAQFLLRAWIATGEPGVARSGWLARDVYLPLVMKGE